MNRKRLKVLTLSMMITLCLGCAAKGVKTPAPLPAGFVSEYDAETYNGLATAAATINAAKARFTGNPQAKVPLNNAIKAYNVARTAYLNWHDTAMLNPAADHSAVDQVLVIMISAIAAINQQFGPTIPAKTSYLEIPRLEAL
jgi:hypothetical protein